MLTQETKRKIDSARQILVGKVPDPKAQVEQITTALIYKFMDDMDKESQELGGKARFFTNGHEKYAWTKLMDAKLGGHERLDLYLEAVSNLSRNQHLPQLFRNIFGDKSLPPYRDAQTLTLFLKEINNFNLDHSEDLGDAYEYLLNVIGTSGEAGQFRTPRHIIDFIVAIIDPKKDETICDPACGTAGFLISAFKHILKENKEKSLTPDERKNLMNHFVGYDIEPGMVRIATVNMYLHNFPEPKIFEYDTLTYEDRWDENFDVMLANPPFMTPKGGIRPHKRFSVQANRSEVLFVDYIADHLNISGKAGVIVPEGIIFNNQTAYKNLRKKLVEDYLIAVISLPQGVFIKPGGKGNVKTGILIFDKALAKKTKDILFLKISNDGFDLGAQRRPIDKNDLPLALEIISKYKILLKENKKLVLNAEQAKIAHFVAKEKIALSGDYNLTGEKYKEPVERINQKWPMVELGEVCEIEKGTSITKAKVSSGKIPVIAGGQQPAYYHNQSNRKGKTITISASGAYAGFVNYFETPIFASDCTTIKTKDENKLLTDFVFHLLKAKQKEIYKFQRGTGQPHVYGKELAKIKIPLPPIEVQKEICDQIEVKQKAISAAKAVIKNLERERRYFGQEIRKIKDVEWVELEGVCTEMFAGGDVPKDYSKTKNDEYKIPIYSNGIGDKSLYGFTKKARVDRECVTISARGTIGYPEIRKEPFYPAIRLIVAIPKPDVIDTRFLKYILETIKINRTGNTIPQLTVPMIKKEKIPLPSLEVQKQLVAEMEEQEKIIEANKKLVGMMEQKITEVLSEI